MAGIFARRHKPESPGFLFANPNRQRRGRPGTRVTLVRNKHRNATDLRCNKRFLNCSLFGRRNNEQMKPASFSCTQQLQANEPAYNLRQPENSVGGTPRFETHRDTLEQPGNPLVSARTPTILCDKIKRVHPIHLSLCQQPCRSSRKKKKGFPIVTTTPL